MGGPISGILLEIFGRGNLGQNEGSDTALSNVCWWIFFITDNETNPSTLLHTLNEIDSNIKFTMELESNNKLPYLDVLVIKKGNKLDTTIYKKPNINDNIIPK